MKGRVTGVAVGEEMGREGLVGDCECFCLLVVKLNDAETI